MQLLWLGQEHDATDHAVFPVKSVDGAPAIIVCCGRGAPVRADSQGCALAISAAENRDFRHPQTIHFRLMGNLFGVTLGQRIVSTRFVAIKVHGDCSPKILNTYKTQCRFLGPPLMKK